MPEGGARVLPEDGARVLGTPVFGAIADAAHSYAPAWLALALWCALGTALATRIREAGPAEKTAPLPVV